MYELTVTRVERLTPSLVRVFFSGGPAEVYGGRSSSDSYMKLYFATNGEPVPFPLDLEDLRQTRGAEAVPTQRTYSLREFLADSGEMAIDFVTHGDAGVAGPWAAQASPGDRLVATSPGGAYAPDPEADWHLFLGDESALPAIAAGIERLDAGARGTALIEVQDQTHELALNAPAGVEVRWLHRGDAEAGTTTLLADAVAELDWLPGVPHIFAHGEREAMKSLRPMVRERAIPRERLSLSGYWAYGRSEDRFQAEKREPIGKIL
ncbi:siderophore-interacting protein [Leucobacter sp. M11]|uniref:siderophore-interacting protein n=1 Tax=Leucobacter sp. M11 TaxID=2993565 RepID=UPI002D804CE0|nr:siderophore-interacting protein [Leucobacter sp. M11]MEB4616507.1 siderophore-interacting protein [Leucobacter sp. M11]